MSNDNSGECTDGMKHYPEPVAAERISGVVCDYDCGNEADWLVEVEGWTGFVCCQSCSVSNRIYAKENELCEVNVSEQARQSVDAGINPSTKGSNDE